MSIIDSMIKIEVAKARESVMYQILGRFGKRISDDVADEITSLAKGERLEVERVTRSIVRKLN
jgi:hypothetical protein